LDVLQQGALSPNVFFLRHFISTFCISFLSLASLNGYTFKKLSIPRTSVCNLFDKLKNPSDKEKIRPVQRNIFSKSFENLTTLTKFFLNRLLPLIILPIMFIQSISEHAVWIQFT